LILSCLYWFPAVTTIIFRGNYSHTMAAASSVILQYKKSTMKLFKVSFGNNKAVSANQVDASHYENLEIDTSHGKSEIKWLTVFADNEAESMSTANKVVNDYFSGFLLSC
jgi:hypothetical protein